VNALELADQFKSATPEQVKAAFASMSEAECLALLYDWSFWARPSQLLPPGDDWKTWLIMAGRGFGKTRTGAETILKWMEDNPGRRFALVGATAADVRDVMVEGESGLLACAPPWFQLKYEPSKRRVTARNGAKAFCFSAEEPDQLRGPQFHGAWADELASWPEPEDPAKDTAWSMLQFCVRLKPRLKIVVTTTPKPTETIIRLATKTKGVRVTEGHTLENRANLDKGFLLDITGLYGGTRLGAQELGGKLLLDTPGALFKVSMFYETAVPRPPDLQKIVVSVDPANSSKPGSDMTGIFVEGLGSDGDVYLLKDATMKGSPDEWARAAVKAYYQWGASYVVAETNVGGDMVATTLQTVDPNVPVAQVRAMQGKAKRAEPVAAKLEQGKLHIVGDPSAEEWKTFVDQARTFTGINGKRDDRVDAFCWGVHDLLFQGPGFFVV
jgi:predicted phage terminase large subunit-like protein